MVRGVVDLAVAAYHQALRPTGAGPEPVLIGGVTYMTGSVLSPRGPERLMIGGHREVYYTPDHYTTFINLGIAR